MTDTNLVYPYEFEGGKKAVASEVNANFEAVKSFAGGINADLNDIRKAIADLKNKPTREMLDVYYSFSGTAPVGAYPLWTGETITNCKSLYPQFWNKINTMSKLGTLQTVTAEEYAEKLETYGQCASFYIDSLNGHVRLPKISKFISSIADLTELAKEEKAGLPNITGSLRPYRMGEPSGAFYNSENGDFYHTNSKDGSSSGAQCTTMFDASKSSDIYGASNTVQPPAVKLCLYLQVANNTAEISELDVNAVIEQMNTALNALQAAYDKYTADLESLYAKIKRDILDSSPVIKEENVAVTTELFVADETYSDYPFKADIALADALAEHVPSVNFGLEQCESGNFAPVASAGNGYVRIYAKAVPESGFVIPAIILQ